MPPKMHSKKRQASSFTLKALSAAVVSALLLSNAYAAGLGKLTVMSSLGQPLRAEIELTSVSKDEVGALVAKLASSEAFRQANIEFNPTLLSLRFTVDQRAGRQFIRINSSQPVNEPFVDLLLELAGPNSRMVREYTFLLDPADMRSTQTAQVAPLPVPGANANKGAQAATPSEPPKQAAPADMERPAPRATARPAPPAAPAAEAKPDGAQSEYLVKNGDSLAKIANQMRSGGISLDQMLVALYRANPDAFINKNMNRLRAGHILSIPNEEAARSVDKTEAHGVVVAQSADFKNYRSKLAGQVATAASQKSESKQSSTGKITAKVEEPTTPAGESQDKLKLSKAPTPGNAGAEKGGAAAAAAEDKIAREKAAAEANARVKELEKNVTDMQKLLELKNQSLAEQQKQAEAKSAAPAAQAPATPAPAAVAPAPAAPAASTDAPPAAKPAEEAKTDQPAAAAAPAAAPEAAAPKPKKPAPVPAPVPEPSLVDELLDNPLVLPGAGLLLAALGALGIVTARRRKQSRNFDDSIITDSSLKANSLFGSTGGQSVDTNNSVFNSNFSATASQLDSNEVDPVAEADVYIAYGRDAQAEEILKEALRTQPDRHAVRVKLLEIYSNRKDLRAFEVLATELYGMTKGQGDDWKQAAALGAAIDPNNPLYAAGKSEKKPGSEPGVLVAPTQPMNEQGLATLLASTQSNSALGDIGDLGVDTSYFSNPARNQKPVEPMDEPPLEAPTVHPSKPASNEMDFDLDALGSIEVPNTIARPVPVEPSVDMSSIDFDFLQEPNITPDSRAAQPASASLPEFKLDEPAAPAAEKVEHDDSPLSIDFPSVADIPEAEPVAKQEPADFDLSDISLELSPPESESKPDLAFDTGGTFDTGSGESSSSDAEMATKLDLAIAYQEIGDKEGARELLDEVLKGGNAEQSEKAKSLLHELA
ncbi:MAG: pilus assembly protein FimV [Burkholderiales bacterium]